MNKELLLALLIYAGVVWAEVLSCDSCGAECKSACGTKHFRTCCFNYLKKKRSSDHLADELPLQMIDPSLRLELQLINSRNHFFYDAAGALPSAEDDRRDYRAIRRFNFSKLSNSRL